MRLFVVVIAVSLLSMELKAEPVSKGEVTLPLFEWDAMMDELRPDPSLDYPPVPVSRIERRIEGRFLKGLFRGTLVDRFTVQDDSGYVQVPILDANVSLGAVSVSGKGTALFKADEMYTLGVDHPGLFEVRLEFFWGEDNDRFARALRFQLPEGGVTTLSVWVPETDIEPNFVSGVMTKNETRGNETLVEGKLNASGTVDFSWARKRTHRTDVAVALEAAEYTVFTAEEAVVSGMSVFDFTVREGETDWVAVALPAGVEVVKVEGDAVLQWAQESKSGGGLTVFLRHLVSDATRFFVYFQMPSDTEKPVTLKMPLPLPGVPFTASAGVQGPLGLKIRISKIASAQEIPVRDLPRALTDLTDNPLLFGFSFSAPARPEVAVTVTKQAEIELTSTVIEEIQASTVQVADGTRITKMKLRIRNNTRETMQVTLPVGAVLTHALLEGAAVRPALSPSGKENVLLFPLRQSERLVEGEPRAHVVRPGETLSDIANFYFSVPTRWQEILAVNPGLSATSLFVGQTLMIPAPAGARFEESTFVLELAYKEKRKALGYAGTVEMTLPSFDVDAMEVLWHVYFPEAINPLSVESNLVQYSFIRYDLFRRAEDFIKRALGVQNAWAGGDYQNILKNRKAIYRTETVDAAVNEAVRSAFPLVGNLYKFKRILLQQDTPRIKAVYADRIFGVVADIAALIIGFFITLLLLTRYRDPRAWVMAGVCLGVTFFAAHYFLGMHRRLLWGADLALIYALVRANGPSAFAEMKNRLWAPWRLIPLFTFRNLAYTAGLLFVLAVMLMIPLFVSTVTFFALLLRWQRARTQTEEVRHG